MQKSEENLRIIQKLHYRHMKQSILDQAEDKRHENTGRPRKLDERDERSILRQLHDLRDTVGTSSSKDIQVQLVMYVTGQLGVC